MVGDVNVSVNVDSVIYDLNLVSSGMTVLETGHIISIKKTQSVRKL